MTAPNPPVILNFANWYWIVAGSTTQVYSSADVAYVALDNAAYLAWLAQGNIPAKQATEQDLWDQLYNNNVTLPAAATTSDANKTQRVANVDLVIFRALFNLNNRVRVLEGQAALTVPQFITAIKALM